MSAADRDPDGGVTLASPFNKDPDGQTRGADGKWDRGAYEFGVPGSERDYIMQNSPEKVMAR